MGDYYPPEERGKAISFLSVMVAIGILLGQIIASTIGAAAGWRVPFAIVAIPTLILGPIIRCTVKEPALGGKEKLIRKAAMEMNQSDPLTGEVQEEFYTEKITWDKLKMLAKNKTVWFSLWQGIPGCGKKNRSNMMSNN